MGMQADGSGAESVSPQEAEAIAMEAYCYFYPLVTMDVTRKQATNVPLGVNPMLGPMNMFHHAPAYPTADLKIVVRPNFDTLYSSAWLDLTSEPMIVSAPDTKGRYYMLPMLDMWTDIFAVPGKRTTGTAAGHFAIVGPGWKGTLPAEFTRIDAPTPYIWIIGRTQTNGPKDYPAVHEVQAGYRATPLSQWGKAPQKVVAKIDPSIDMKTPPLTQVNGMKAADYFRYSAELLKLHPPHIQDQPILARLKRIGIERGKSFDFAKASPAIQEALTKGSATALKLMQAKTNSQGRLVNGWGMNTESMGAYGVNYFKRAIITMVGLGANLPEDAVYPLNVGDAEGKPLSGENRYVIRFKKGETPPADAFWSVTLYDSEGFQVANGLNRFAIGDRDGLKFAADGSLELYFQNESPGADRESNWLPAPKGPFNLTMRLYAPRREVLDGSWAPPVVEKTK